MMDLHSGDSLLNYSLTLVGCWLGILPLDVGVLLIVWWMPLLRECPTWEEECRASWRRELGPR
jgi:hypothetical protein